MNTENENEALPLDHPSPHLQFWQKCIPEKHRNRMLALLCLGLYCLDLGSDIYVSQELFRDCEYIFGGLAIVFILLPNIVASLFAGKFLPATNRLKVLVGTQYFTFYLGLKAVLFGSSDSLTQFNSLKLLAASIESQLQLYLTLYILFTEHIYILWEETIPTAKIISCITSYISFWLGTSHQDILKIDPAAPFTIVLCQMMTKMYKISLEIVTYTVSLLSFKYFVWVPSMFWGVGESLAEFWARRSITSEHPNSGLNKIVYRRCSRVLNVLLSTALMGIVYVLTSVDYVHLLPYVYEYNRTKCDSCQSSCSQYADPGEIRFLIYVVLCLALIFCIEGFLEFVAFKCTPFGMVIKYQREIEKKEQEEQEIERQHQERQEIERREREDEETMRKEQEDEDIKRKEEEEEIEKSVQGEEDIVRKGKEPNKESTSKIVPYKYMDNT